MSIYLSIKNVKSGKDYLFLDDVSKDCYQNALFRLNFKFDSLNKENIEVVDEFLQNNLNNLLEILNGSDDSSINSGSHEDRIKSLEDEIATLTNNVNSQTPIHGILKITPTSVDMDFNNEGTMIKFTNQDGGVYTTSILKKDVVNEIVLPVGVYTVNIVNSLNDIVDSVFSELWENATSNDDNHTMEYTVVEGEIDIETILTYE